MNVQVNRKGGGGSAVLDMTKGSPAMLLLRFTAPMLLGNLFQQFYNLADSIIVGRFVGGNELGGIGSTGSISYLIFSIGYGMAAGTGIQIAMLFGAEETWKLKKAIYNSFYALSGAALLITLTGCIWAEPILTAMKTPPAVLPYAVLYLRITALGSIASMLYNGLSSIMRAFGDASTPLFILMFACVCNVGMDLLLVLVFQMGVAGVALATVIAQILAAAVSFFCACRRIPYFRYEPGVLAPDRELLGQCLKLGLPIAGQNAMIAVSCIVLQVVVNGFGELVVTANTAVSKIEQLVQQPYNSLSSALSSFTGQNMGANKQDRVRKGFRTGIFFVITASIILFLVMQLFGHSILSVFVTEPEVVEIGVTALRITSCFYIFLGLIYTVRGTLNGAGDTFYSAMNGIIELCCRIGLSAPLTYIPFIGMWGCFLCSGLTWTITGLLSLKRYLGGKWQIKAERK